MEKFGPQMRISKRGDYRCDLRGRQIYSATIEIKWENTSFNFERTNPITQTTNHLSISSSKSSFFDADVVIAVILDVRRPTELCRWKMNESNRHTERTTERHNRRWNSTANAPIKYFCQCIVVAFSLPFLPCRSLDALFTLCVSNEIWPEKKKTRRKRHSTKTIFNCVLVRATVCYWCWLRSATISFYFITYIVRYTNNYSSRRVCVYLFDARRFRTTHVSRFSLSPPPTNRTRKKK